MRIRYNFIVITLLFLTSCHFYTDYEFDICMKGYQGDQCMNYQDSNMLIKFTFHYDCIEFDLKNTSKIPLRILWDQSAYINESNNSIAIAHKGIKYATAQNSQVPTVIAPGTSVNEVIVPKDNIIWSSGYSTGQSYVPGRYTQYPIFYYRDFGGNDMEEVIIGYKGKNVSLYLAFDEIGKISYKTFTFDVLDVYEKGSKPIGSTP